MLESFKNLSYYQAVFLDILAIDEDIIHVHRHLTFSYQICEHRVHEGLEGGRTVCHAEVHHSWLKQSSVHDNGSLSFVSFSDTNIVIPPSNVEFSEVLRLR